MWWWNVVVVVVVVLSNVMSGNGWLGDVALPVGRWSLLLYIGMSGDVMSYDCPE